MRSTEMSRRVELITRLRDIVLMEGFSQLTTDGMSARLECSKATLYSLAPSKDDLILALLGGFLDQVDTSITIKVGDVTEPVDRIAIHLETVAGEMRRMSAPCYQDMISCVSTCELYRHHLRRLAARLSGMIDDGVKRGVFRPANAIFTAAAVNLVSGAIDDGRIPAVTGLSSGDGYVQLARLVVAGLSNVGYERAVFPR